MKFFELQKKIITCNLCPRLVEWREKIALQKTLRFSAETYWGKPVPGFGDSNAQLLIVGLAPAAHGGNRTGRIFTGDKSGDWLFRALYNTGFANQPISTDVKDGLILTNCYITTVVHCAPPENKPNKEETVLCRKYLEQELALLKKVQVIVTLGKFAFENTLAALKNLHITTQQTHLEFGHHKIFSINSNLTMISCYHPSQRNTFTKLLTEDMLDAVFKTAREQIVF